MFYFVMIKLIEKVPIWRIYMQKSHKIKKKRKKKREKNKIR